MIEAITANGHPPLGLYAVGAIGFFVVLVIAIRSSR